MGYRKLIVAHRGDQTKAHQNTLDAAVYAMECGADMIEFDVRRTRDGELIVHHDEGVGGRLLAEIDYNDTLPLTAKLGYRIPRLEEMLRLTSGRIRLDVELKESGYEASVMRMLFEHASVADFLITSFEAHVLSQVRSVSPGARVGLLVSDVSSADALARFFQSEADFLAPDDQLLDEGTLAEAARLKIPLLPWTVNGENAVRIRLEDPAIFGVITDRLGEALRVRNAVVRRLFP